MKKWFRNQVARTRPVQSGQSVRTGKALPITSGIVLLVAVSGAGAIPSAHAASPKNHIYVRDHGAPSCTVKFEHYDSGGNRAWKEKGVGVGDCNFETEWDPDEVAYVHVYINSGLGRLSKNYNSSTGSGHDHCILVKAFGSIVETGDETQGCHS